MVSVLMTGKRLFCANVGDSRAILIKNIDGVLKPTPLSVDQKPENA